MQGGTVEAAVVVASPRDLSAGWSYSALSRARGETHLLIYDERHQPERSEFSPREQPLTPSRADLLARVEHRMARRDDEELATQRLPGLGRPHDRALSSARALGKEIGQERAAIRAEPPLPVTAGIARLRDLREQTVDLKTQLQALPQRELQRIDDLDARASILTTQRQALAERLTELPQPRRRFGRTHDSHPVERAYRTSSSERCRCSRFDSPRCRGVCERCGPSSVSCGAPASTPGHSPPSLSASRWIASLALGALANSDSSYASCASRYSRVAARSWDVTRSRAPAVHGSARASISRVKNVNRRSAAERSALPRLNVHTLNAITALVPPGLGAVFRAFAVGMKAGFDDRLVGAGPIHDDGHIDCEQVEASHQSFLAGAEDGARAHGQPARSHEQLDIERRERLLVHFAQDVLRNGTTLWILTVRLNSDTDLY
jgi:hypothetical protein